MSSHPDVFLGKGVLKICSKFTDEYPCRSAISIKLQSNFSEIAKQLCFCIANKHSRRTFNKTNNVLLDIFNQDKLVRLMSTA